MLINHYEFGTGFHFISQFFPWLKGWKRLKMTSWNWEASEKYCPIYFITLCSLCNFSFVNNQLPSDLIKSQKAQRDHSDIFLKTILVEAQIRACDNTVKLNPLRRLSRGQSSTQFNVVKIINVSQTFSYPMPCSLHDIHLPKKLKWACTESVYSNRHNSF